MPWFCRHRLILVLMLCWLLPGNATAMAMTIDGITLPAPLNSADIERYQQIISLQQDKKWKAADKLIGKLDNKLLLGRMLAQRYLHPTGWRSTYKQLSDWLVLYHDHPAASRISWLAKKRKPKSAAAPTAPSGGYLNGYGRAAGRYAVAIPASAAGRASPARTRAIARDIRRKIRSGWPSGAKQVIDAAANRKYLTRGEEAQLHAEIAHGYFIYGKDHMAMASARQAIGLAGLKVARAYWTAGIAAWRSGDLQQAADFFDLLARHDDAAPALQTAAAFWASRAAMRRAEPVLALEYLDIAARHPDSFYGSLAAAALGQEMPVDFTLPPLKQSFISWLEAQPAGNRAFGLLQIGEVYHASRELRTLWDDMSDDHRHQLMRLTEATGMAGLAFRAADLIRRQTGRSWYGALYPLPHYELSDDRQVDRALLYAVIRQESGFNPRAKSSARAMGLMQLLPSTAAFVARDRRYRGSKRHDLLLPQINIGLGERYILHLLEEPLIEGDLVRLLAAYNGGPGNLKKWLRKISSLTKEEDVLMMLESLPSRETRFYVKNVLTNLWMYRQRLGEEPIALLRLTDEGQASFSPGIAENPATTAID